MYREPVIIAKEPLQADAGPRQNQRVSVLFTMMTGSLDVIPYEDSSISCAAAWLKQ